MCACTSVQYNTNYTNNAIKVSWIRCYLEMAGDEGGDVGWEEGVVESTAAK